MLKGLLLPEVSAELVSEPDALSLSVVSELPEVELDFRLPLPEVPAVLLVVPVILLLEPVSVEPLAPEVPLALLVELLLPEVPVVSVESVSVPLEPNVPLVLLLPVPVVSVEPVSVPVEPAEPWEVEYN